MFSSQNSCGTAALRVLKNTTDFLQLLCSVVKDILHSLALSDSEGEEKKVKKSSKEKTTASGKKDPVTYVSDSGERHYDQYTIHYKPCFSTVCPRRYFELVQRNRHSFCLSKNENSLICVMQNTSYYIMLHLLICMLETVTNNLLMVNQGNIYYLPVKGMEDYSFDY